MLINIHSHRAVKQTILQLVLAILLLALSNSSQAEEITQNFHGLTINANLEMAEGKNFKDGMVLILHGVMAHNKMELIHSAQQALLDNEKSSLAINLSLNRDNRHGFYDCTWPHRHKQDEVFDELGIWVDWLRKKGVSKIALMAHSRGANQAMVYAVEHLDPEVTHLIFLAIGSDDVKESHEERYGKIFDVTLERMHQQITSNNGEALVENIDFWFCPKASVTANSFISYYGEGSKFKKIKAYLPQIPIPTLIITGTQDERFPNTKKNVSPLVDGKRLRLIEIEGAGHFFRDLNIEEAMEVAIEFMADSK